jgi:hypothetical protein
MDVACRWRRRRRASRLRLLESHDRSSTRGGPRRPDAVRGARRPTHPTGGWAGCATETYDAFLGKPWERIGGARHHASPMEGAEVSADAPENGPPTACISSKTTSRRTPGSTRAQAREQARARTSRGARRVQGARGTHRAASMDATRPVGLGRLDPARRCCGGVRRMSPLKPVTLRTRRITVVAVVLAALALPFAAYSSGIGSTTTPAARGQLHPHPPARGRSIRSSSTAGRPRRGTSGTARSPASS